MPVTIKNPDIYGIPKMILETATKEELMMPKQEYKGDEYNQMSEKIAIDLIDKYVNMELTEYHYKRLIFNVRTMIIENQ